MYRGQFDEEGLGMKEGWRKVMTKITLVMKTWSLKALGTLKGSPGDHVVR